MMGMMVVSASTTVLADSIICLRTTSFLARATASKGSVACKAGPLLGSGMLGDEIEDGLAKACHRQVTKLCSEMTAVGRAPIAMPYAPMPIVPDT